MEASSPSCASCPFPVEERLCRNPEGKGPSSCPVRMEDLVEEAARLYEGPELREFALQASLQEACGYSGRAPGNHSPVPCKPRLLETAEFAERMGYRKLGLVFCTGLRKEAAAVDGFLRDRGFQVVSVICKAGRIPKETIGVKDGEKIVPGTLEPMCNPVMQALVLNRAGTEFNIVTGLCVGHDSLFMMHSKAPCTVLVAKDRTSAHSPAAAIYTLEGYSRYLKEQS
ncbi:MAG TPA: DUF1847 domain-containing protein [Candidatus Sabulitectum sp.]|nr:DUF1847 domain-containing protein [Candidatus Sabulitectum sp.]HPJ29263.1 DUF1847 domain-containing protein [Candidatus Sabulitectum sp.]HPR23520.1 DUF1847 domain-containing protein [Candidatus Sabulitectum sp.]